MKQFLTILFSFFCFVSFAQLPNTHTQSNGHTKEVFLGGINPVKGLINGRYTDTTAANADYIKGEPGVQIIVGNTLYIRDVTGTKWIAAGTSPASTVSILNDSSIAICNSSGCDTFKFTNIVVNNFSVVNDSTILVCDGSNVCDTLFIPPTPIAKTYVDSTVIRGGDSLYYYINGQAYFGGTITAATQSTVSIANDSTLVICNQSGCDTFHFQNIIVNNFSVLNDSTIIVCDGNNTCDTLHITPIQIAKSYVDSVKVEGSLVYYYINGNNVLAGVLGGKDGLISGGQVVWSGQGLKFYVSPATYIINQKFYSSPLDSVILDSASTFSRVDLFIVDTTSHAGKITGIADGNLLTPQVDPSSQIALTTGLQINPGDTIPANVDITHVYLDNSIPPDWATGTQGAAMTIEWGSTTNPYAGTKDIFISQYNNGSTPYFVSPTLYPITTDAVLSFWIYLNGRLNNPIYAWLYDNTTHFGSRFNITPFFNVNDTGKYQLVTVPLSYFQWSSGYYSGNFNTLLFILSGTDSTKGFRLDNIQFQKGINSVPSPTDFSLKVDSVTIKKITLGSDTANVPINWIKGVPYPKKDTVWTSPGGSTDTTQKVYPLFVIKPILAKNDSTIAFDSLNLTELRYSLGSRDTTQWKDTTLIDKKYFNDRISTFTPSGGGGTTSIQQVTLSSGSKVATFTSVPTAYADYEIFRWGVRLYPVTDYTTSGNNVTILDGEDGEKITFQRIK